FLQVGRLATSPLLSLLHQLIFRCEYNRVIREFSPPMSNIRFPWQARLSCRLLLKWFLWSTAVVLLTGATAWASEADLAIPDLHAGKFDTLGGLSAWTLLFGGACVIAGTLGISLFLRTQIHKLPAHQSMLSVAETIFQTCKTYLIQQGKFLLMLFALIAIAI